MDHSDTDLSLVMKHFEVHNKTEGKSESTVLWYNEVLGLFRGWLKDNGLPTTLEFMDEMTVRQFILHLQNRPGLKGPVASTYTVANRVRALKAFFAWMAKRGYTAEDILEDVKVPKTVELITEPLSENEISAILGGINPNTALGARNVGIISLMLDTGLRRSEVVNLREEDVDLEVQHLKVMGKGSKERFVSFGITCKRALLEYYFQYRVDPAHIGVDKFFLTIDGYPLSYGAIKSMMQRIAKSSSVARLHPHLLRHTYATNFLLNGGDIFLLKSNLGHSSLKMVMHYVHIAAQTTAMKSQPFSPLDNMNIKHTRRFRHSMNRANGMHGRIYPNVGNKRKKWKRSDS